MPGLYYLILWKSYCKEENTWKPLLIVIYLQKLISIFHKEYLENLIATSLSLNSGLLIARPTVPKEQQPKQKRGRSIKKANERGRNEGITRNSDAFYGPRCEYCV